MDSRKIDFSQIEWQINSFGIKSKTFEKGHKRIRLLELERGSEHPDWCLTGHIGLVVEGTLEIDFDGEIITYSAGDALLIAEGENEKHRPKPTSEKVILFLVEEF